MTKTAFGSEDKPGKPIRKKKTKPEVIEEKTFEDPYIAWRWKRFIDLGYDAETSEKMANSRIDAHHIESHLGRGCSLEHALRIEASLDMTFDGDDEIDLGEWNSEVVE